MSVSQQQQYNPFKRSDPSFQFVDIEQSNAESQGLIQAPLNYQKGMGCNILPVDADFFRQQSPIILQNKVQKIIPRFRYLSFTFVITCLQILMFITTNIYYLAQKKTGENDKQIWNNTLIIFGAQLQNIDNSYKYWRLLMSIMLHANFVHLINNMIMQNIYGHMMEYHLKRRYFIFVYLLAGVGGNLLSLIFLPSLAIGVGASGSIFGIFGMQLIYYLKNLKTYGERKSTVLGAFIFLLLINLITGFQSLQSDSIGNPVDMWAHGGGFVVGILFAIISLKNGFYEQQFWDQRVKIGSFILLAMFFSFTYYFAMNRKN